MIARSRVLLLGLALAASGCGRLATVLRGSTSVFRSTRPAPVEVAEPIARDARLSVLWVGHATTLIQIDDAIVATDPVVTSTVGTLAKRLVAPGLPAARWPRVDAALISHVHFDHLSFGSLEALEPKIGVLVMPEGGLSYLPSFDFDAIAIPRWSSREVATPSGGLRVTAVPARHGGFRWGVDAGWARAAAGFVIERADLSVYFAGDTGFDAALFGSIRARWPSLDLALLPIAPVEPHDEVGAWHMDPSEAVEALRILGADAMVPIHFDTFLNSLDDPGDATRALDDALARSPVDRGRVHVLRVGERVVLVPRTR